MMMRKRKVVVLWSVLIIAGALGALLFIMPKLSLWNDCIETKMKMKLPIKG